MNSIGGMQVAVLQGLDAGRVHKALCLTGVRAEPSSFFRMSDRACRSLSVAGFACSWDPF